jgi:hypothetical protein
MFLPDLAFAKSRIVGARSALTASWALRLLFGMPGPRMTRGTLLDSS